MSRQTPYLMMQLGETLGNALQDRRDRSRREMFGQRLADIAQSEENPVKAMMTVQREFPDFATPDTFKMLDMVYTDKKRQQVDNLAKTVMSLKDSMQDADPKADAVGLYAQRIKEAASQYSPDVQEVAFTALKRLHEAKREPEDPLIAIDKTKDYMRRNGRGGYETVFPSVAPDIEITRHNPTNNMIESRKIRADAWERVKEQMGGQGWQEGEMKAGPGGKKYQDFGYGQKIDEAGNIVKVPVAPRDNTVDRMIEKDRLMRYAEQRREAEAEVRALDKAYNIDKTIETPQEYNEALHNIYRKYPEVYRNNRQVDVRTGKPVSGAIPPTGKTKSGKPYWVHADGKPYYEPPTGE